APRARAGSDPRGDRSGCPPVHPEGVGSRPSTAGARHQDGDGGNARRGHHRDTARRAPAAPSTSQDSPTATATRGAGALGSGPSPRLSYLHGVGPSATLNRPPVAEVMSSLLALPCALFMSGRSRTVRTTTRATARGMRRPSSYLRGQ